MAEGGRKVWNEQQFKDLNEGAICRAKVFGEYINIEKGETRDDGEGGTETPIYYFGNEVWDYSRHITEWPIDLIWEPNDDQ